AGAGQADADVGVLAFAGTVDDAAHHGHGHVFDAGVPLAPFRHAVADVILDLLREFLEIRAGGAAAARAGDHHRRERAQSHGLENLLGDDHFLSTVPAGFGSEGDANGVADAL